MVFHMSLFIWREDIGKVGRRQGESLRTGEHLLIETTKDQIGGTQRNIFVYKHTRE